MKRRNVIKTLSLGAAVTTGVAAVSLSAASCTFWKARNGSALCISNVNKPSDPFECTLTVSDITNVVLNDIQPILAMPDLITKAQELIATVNPNATQNDFSLGFNSEDITGDYTGKPLYTEVRVMANLDNTKIWGYFDINIKINLNSGLINLAQAADSIIGIGDDYVDTATGQTVANPVLLYVNNITSVSVEDFKKLNTMSIITTAVERALVSLSQTQYVENEVSITNNGNAGSYINQNTVVIFTVKALPNSSVYTGSFTFSAKIKITQAKQDISAINNVDLKKVCGDVNISLVVDSPSSVERAKVVERIETSNEIRVAVVKLIKEKTSAINVTASDFDIVFDPLGHHTSPIFGNLSANPQPFNIKIQAKQVSEHIAGFFILDDDYDPGDEAAIKLSTVQTKRKLNELSYNIDNRSFDASIVDNTLIYNPSTYEIDGAAKIQFRVWGGAEQGDIVIQAPAGQEDNWVITYEGDGNATIEAGVPFLSSVAPVHGGTYKFEVSYADHTDEYSAFNDWQDVYVIVRGGSGIDPNDTLGVWEFDTDHGNVINNLIDGNLYASATLHLSGDNLLSPKDNPTYYGVTSATHSGDDSPTIPQPFALSWNATPDPVSTHDLYFTLSFINTPVDKEDGEWDLKLSYGYMGSNSTEIPQNQDFSVFVQSSSENKIHTFTYTTNDINAVNWDIVQSRLLDGTWQDETTGYVFREEVLVQGVHGGTPPFAVQATEDDYTIELIPGSVSDYSNTFKVGYKIIAQQFSNYLAGASKTLFVNVKFEQA